MFFAITGAGSNAQINGVEKILESDPLDAVARTAAGIPSRV
jgi:hypothetical protein